MTRFITRPTDSEPRESRVRMPLQPAVSMFQGWGPKF